MKKELIVHKDPKSPISEVFRTLRTNIQFMNTNKKLKTLLVTSTFPGEGKSWVTSNLAVTFAQAGKRVVLIDADMRKGRQYSIFGVSPRPGLSNYLSGIDSDEPEDEIDLSNYIQKTEVNNLLLISAGNIPPNPSELLVSPQMIKLLDELREVCDIIIIDGTPCELVTDSVILSRIVDSTLIVTAHKETKKDALERVIKNIQNVGGNLAGVVLNKIPVSPKKYSETYYYASTETSKQAKNSKRNANSINNRENIKRRANASINQNTTRTTRHASKNTEKTLTKSEQIQIQGKDLEKPNVVKNKPNEGISIEKTNDILTQINSYLDQEKKNLN